jgi:hypothetical protein
MPDEGPVVGHFFDFGGALALKKAKCVAKQDELTICVISVRWLGYCSGRSANRAKDFR